MQVSSFFTQSNGFTNRLKRDVTSTPFSNILGTSWSNLITVIYFDTYNYYYKKNLQSTENQKLKL